MENKRSYKAALLSLGCKVNSYETEKIREDLVLKGFEIVDFSEAADVYIINTCSVTNIADRKSRQMLHRARSLNPDAVIVATGCYVQTEKDKSKLDEIADILIGNNHKGNIADEVLVYIEKLEKGNCVSQDEINRNAFAIDDIAQEKAIESFSINDYPERSRAFVRIEDGCNQFCSYCIIPYARGRVRSRKEEDILEEVKALAEKGFKEVVLTGIHISSYGFENYEKHMKNMSDVHFDGTPLLELVSKISKTEGIERIRLGSLEPRIITREFALGLSKIPEFCPHFHLSLQSGCNTVLKRMNRHYSAEEFLEKCDILREVFDRPAITTDVIVGFPGETEEEFAESMDMCRKASFAKMHIFKYSRRKGTVADKMPGQLTEKTKHERSLKLQALDDEMRDRYISSFIGQEVKILVEEEIDGYLQGLTERYVQVRCKMTRHDEEKKEKTAEGYVSSLVKIRIIKALPDGILLGEL
ncbi:MAG: tRNA (N(6)-L-threonylcarbamoyladenosine(37)-C(2))-methylthiotransferase MtaB [Lachnospiraceae bacterium]|nr:tRNA (N(6)-L-threonylcarbamoyladenosine(37)-C(2))-methylthiotransferase MtaB [Lachnospiraceae bacterium]